MTRLGFALLALLLPGLAAASPTPVVAEHGPVLSAEAQLQSDLTVVEFRYGFSVSEAADLYLKNNPAPYNAAFRDGWTTKVTLHAPSGLHDVGFLTFDHPVELGRFAPGKQFGLAIVVTIPEQDLGLVKTWNLTYVLASHAADDGETNGAFLDPSVGIYLQARVVPNAAPQHMEPWGIAPLGKNEASGRPVPSLNIWFVLGLLALSTAYRRQG